MSASITTSASLPAAAGGRFFTGFTRLCKGLAVILFIGHISVQLFPSATTYLALIPTRTIPFVWNLVTSGYIEQTIPGVIVSIVGLLLFGKLLEPLWGVKELLKFIFIVNLSTSVCVFVIAIVLYYITQQEIYLCTVTDMMEPGYTPLSGFYGVLSGFLVGIKQILPDLELNLCAQDSGKVDSVSCCIYLGCCKLLPEGINVIPSSHTTWHLHKLGLPALLPKEVGSRPKRGPK